MEILRLLNRKYELEAIREKRGLTAAQEAELKLLEYKISTIKKAENC